MTKAGCLVERTFDIHGVGLDLASEAPAVIEAIELRLRGFHQDSASRSELRFEFLVTGSGEGSRVSPPRGPSRPVYDMPGGQIRYYPRSETLYTDVGGVRLRCEAQSGVARVESAAFAARRLYLATHPLTTVGLMELLKRRQRYSLHAACLASGPCAVLLAGPSGAGKSTLAIALVRAGLSFVGDDVVFLHRASGAVQVLGFPDALGVTRATAERFSELRPLLATAPQAGFPKYLLRIEDAFATPALSRCEPQSLIFPEVAPDQPSRILPLDPREAWLRLVPDVLLTEPTATQAHLETLAALLGQVRCYSLLAGADLEQTVQLIHSVLP